MTASSSSRGKRSRGSRDDHSRSDSYSTRCRVQIDQALAAGCYIIFDIETTGGNAQKNGITEICALSYRNGKVSDRYHTLVNPHIPIPPIVRRMTGINDNMVKDAPTIEAVMPEVLDFIGDQVLVSHNCSGDMKFIKHFAFQACRKQIKNFYLCTHLLTTKLFPAAPDKTLQGSAKHLGAKVSSAHRAEGDAQTTTALFTQLLRAMRKRGIETIVDAIRLQGDIDSCMKLGWAIDNKTLQDMPTCPGVIRLFDRERKLVFKASYANLARDVRGLSRYRDLPRTVLRNILQASSLHAQPFPNLYAAMLWEQRLHEGERLIKSCLGYQRDFAAIFLQPHRGGVRIAVGEVPAAATHAFGPIENKQHYWQVIRQIGAIFSRRVGRDGLHLSPTQAVLVEFLLRGELSLKRAEMEKKRTNKFTEFLKSIFLNQGGQGDIDRLEAIELPTSLTSLLDTCGVLAVTSYTRNAWQLYPIVAARPLACLETRRDWRDFLARNERSNAIHKKLQHLLKQHKGLATLQDSSKINITLWWIFCHSVKSERIWISLKELKSAVKKKS